ncbi:MAG: L-serine ammonia-lyase [Hyphomicrobiales bacterium]
MESIKEIYRIGNGPSSSHTMGPRKAATDFIGEYTKADKFEVTLYGSLAATGKGHLTDQAILDVLGSEKTEIIWKPDVFLPRHPNAMLFKAYNDNNELLGENTLYSIGGGKVVDEFTELEDLKVKPIYPLSTMEDILGWCRHRGKHLWEYVVEYEGEEIWDYLKDVWKVMKSSIKRGIDTEGTLPGDLNLARKAASYYVKSSTYKKSLRSRALVFAYALAVSEENAAGGLVVTAPTCGSCGVLPSVLYLAQKNHSFTDSKIYKALATAGLIGNLVKTNASISGAEVGCQGEVGTACAMASAAALQLFGGTTAQIEYAAEMGLEHHLGLTCDPVCGLVQIPCIERNAMAASRALDSNMYAVLSDGVHTVSFDKVVTTMKETGHDLPNLYKETSEGGLATQINRRGEFKF